MTVDYTHPGRAGYRMETRCDKHKQGARVGGTDKSSVCAKCGEAALLYEWWEAAS